MNALNPANEQSNIRDNSGGLAIKGASSGPFVIVGSNFAPGTTAADIQSALEPLSGPVLNCWITSQYPAVTAEIAFAEKWSAENIVANFHNQKVWSFRSYLSTGSYANNNATGGWTGAFDALEACRGQFHLDRAVLQ